jgi:hypothetical protein
MTVTIDTRRIGQFVGAASLSFGITDVLLGKSFGRGIGAGAKAGGTMFRSVGLREIATGVVGLRWPESSIPVWTRFAADLTDLVALAPIVAKPNPKRGMALIAFGTVALVAAMDFFAARAIDNRTIKGE